MPATIEQIRIVLCVLLPLACLVTFFRLFERYRRGKLWWDDFWALICTVCAALFIVVTLLHLEDPGKMKRNEKIAVFYLTGTFFYALVWAVRISILFTIVRLSVGRMRRLLGWLGYAFGGTCAILIAQIFWVCEREPGWKDLPTPQCSLGLSVAIAQLISDVLADIILIAAPMYLFWRLQVRQKLKLRLRAVFATTSISTAVSLYHAYCVLQFGGLPEFLAATIQLSVSLFVANLTVITAVILRLKSGTSESDNIDPSSGGTRSRPRNFGSSALSAVATQADNTPKVNVHIVQTSDRWNESDDEGTRKFGGIDVPDRLELKVLSPEHGFAR